MDWSGRTVSNTLLIDKFTVNDIIVYYVKDQLYVNRRYQRKLVWGLKEKRLLIDSMLKGIPLPAILLVKYRVPPESEEDILEIVDGMQRLNAITSFVMGEFGIEYNGEICYFDPFANNETFHLLQDGKIAKEGKSFLPKDLCIEFCRYSLPVIVTGRDDATVDLIFSRINSTGRKISSHDLRQAKATGEFSDLVRRIASNVRGDCTYSDHICLCDMPKISVGHKKYGYGVELDAVFWVRHSLIDDSKMKESKDEEIIEILVATVLLGEFEKSRESLDDLYDVTTEGGKEIEQKVKEVGKDSLEEKFKKVFDTFDMIFNSVSSSFLIYLFEKEKVRNKAECFKAVFLAIYRLISEGYVITDYEGVAESLRDSVSVLNNIVSSNKIDSEDAQTATNNLYKLLKSSFAKEIVTEESEMTKEIDKRLCYSRIERQMTEFKIGISGFKKKSVNESVIHDIAKTLVAMANNTNATEDGLLIVGIADGKEAYDDWCQVFHQQVLISNQHYVPGITKEAEKLDGNTDGYYRHVKELIKQEDISEKLKEYVLNTFSVCNYHDAELLVFRSKNVGEVSLYQGEKYVRHSSSTEKVSK